MIEIETPQRIRLSNGSVVDTYTFYNTLTQILPIETPILPPNISFYSRLIVDTNDKIIHQLIYTFPPHVMQLKFRNNNNNPKLDMSGTYEISVPFTHLCLNIIEKTDQYQVAKHDIYYFLTPKPLTNLDNDVYLFPVHNYYNDQSLCVGTIPRPYSDNLYDCVLNFIAEFHHASWNTDLYDDSCLVPAELGGSYNNWQALTKENRLVGLSGDIKWHKISSLRSLCC